MRLVPAAGASLQRPNNVREDMSLDRRRLDRIAAHYEAMKEDFRRTPANRWAIDPYAWHAVVSMTPIEASLWSDIRIEGVVMYPQFPVGRFFVDYGNPVAKVAIECDGKQFHLDKEKDAARQREIEALGWTVYRLSGAACNTPDTYEMDDDTGIERLIPGPARSLIRMIAEQHAVSMLRGGT
jgi:very-short-patch-repair endonuclease